MPAGVGPCGLYTQPALLIASGEGPILPEGRKDYDIRIGLSMGGFAPSIEEMIRGSQGRICLVAGWLVLGCFDAESDPGDVDLIASAGNGGSASDLGGSGNSGGSGSDESSTASGGGSDNGSAGMPAIMTAAHNQVRRVLGEELPDLTWSDDLATYASEWAESLAMRCNGISHRTQNSYGENIAMRGSSRLTVEFSPAEAVEGWAAEAECWDFGTINGSESCSASCVGALNSSGCGHYTQLVWRDTQNVGCGYATCTDGFEYEIWVCNYDPPGNFIGRAPY